MSSKAAFGIMKMESQGEILRRVAEKFERGDLETEREILSVGGFEEGA